MQRIIIQHVDGKPISHVAKICRFLSFLCITAFIIVVLWGIFVFCLICYSILTGNISNDGLATALAVPIVYLLYMANASLIPLTLWKMLHDISGARTPFTLFNVKRLFHLAVILLFYSVLEALLIAVDAQFMVFIGENEIQVGNMFYDFTAHSGTTLNLFPLLMSAMFFALSYVFKYGVLLQQESDETL